MNWIRINDVAFNMDEYRKIEPVGDTGVKLTVSGCSDTETLNFDTMEYRDKFLIIIMEHIEAPYNEKNLPKD